MFSSGPSLQPAQQVPAGNFTDMISKAAQSSLQTIRSGEVTAQQAIIGQVGTQQAVEAVMAMENSLRTSLAVRDKMVEAYQEIMRMPV